MMGIRAVFLAFAGWANAGRANAANQRNAVLSSAPA
jgi:hypothetical protein